MPDFAKVVHEIAVLVDRGRQQGRADTLVMGLFIPEGRVDGVVRPGPG